MRSPAENLFTHPQRRDLDPVISSPQVTIMTLIGTQTCYNLRYRLIAHADRLDGMAVHVQQNITDLDTRFPGRAACFQTTDKVFPILVVEVGSKNAPWRKFLFASTLYRMPGSHLLKDQGRMGTGEYSLIRT